MAFSDVSYFLGANSPHGFVSRFSTIIADECKKVYVIKGSPGSGKSTLLKKIADRAESYNVAVERIYCSSDTGSLDAVFIPSRGILIADGTAPQAGRTKRKRENRRRVRTTGFVPCTPFAAQSKDPIGFLEHRI